MKLAQTTSATEPKATNKLKLSWLQRNHRAGSKLEFFDSIDPFRKMWTRSALVVVRMSEQTSGGGQTGTFTEPGCSAQACITDCTNAKLELERGRPSLTQENSQKFIRALSIMTAILAGALLFAGAAAAADRGTEAQAGIGHESNCGL
jgi:hypothetical protein